ncbi:hypothetical protein BDM02DRAFT_3259184 [Thelephora ganbajun]|uniref:Uncharacterized protein n=1 Tax=Thelephora ganbajun TaxID=370292 RepID=A0ACB6ZN27_THEGA|nr:hypothetical protein BDM02DRAFT_3259184 [Thelephora ganbajun]
MRGDTSNTTVDRFWVYVMQTLGIHFCSADISPFTIRIHAIHAQLMWEDIVDIQRGDDYRLKVQLRFVVAATAVLLRFIRTSHLYIRRCCELINTMDMRFIPVYGRPPELSEGVREDLTVLSQIIYLDNYLFLTCDGPSPKQTAKIEKEFRYELGKVYPILFDICPLTMRTQGILLVRDTTLFLRICVSGERVMDRWRETCSQLIQLLDEYSDVLLRNLRQFLKIGDDAGGSLIASACISCLAHLAALYHFAARTEPAATASDPMDKLCDRTLLKLATLTQDARIKEYTYYDLLLKMSWKKSLEIFDARISALPSDERRTLQRLKGIVSQAHLDLQNNIPECAPPELMMLTWLEDGRTETSRYPNLLSAVERERFGL